MINKYSYLSTEGRVKVVLVSTDNKKVEIKELERI